MFNWEFRDPLFLLLLPVAAIVFWLANRSRSSLTFSSLTLVANSPKSMKLWLAKLPALLFALATIAMIVGLARPRTPERETRVSRDGIAIMMMAEND